MAVDSDLNNSNLKKNGLPQKESQIGKHSETERGKIDYMLPDSHTDSRSFWFLLPLSH